jgi:hypothetical protein
MTIYRVTHRDVFDEHQGYSYHTIKKEADSLQNKNNKENGKDDEIEVEEVKLTKKGVIRILTLWASHPDNG